MGTTMTYMPKSAVPYMPTSAEEIVQPTVTPKTDTGLFGLLKQMTGFGEKGVLTNYGKDLGVALGTKSKEGKALAKSQSDTLAMAERARQKAKTVTDPEARKRLLKVAGQGAEIVGQGAEQTQGQFSQDIDKNYLGRSLGVGAKIATTADLVNFFTGSPEVLGFKGSPNIVERTVNLIKGVKNVFSPLKSTGKKLELVRSTVDVPTTDLEDSVLENVYKNRNYNIAPTEFQKEVTDTTSRLLSRTSPWKTASEGVNVRAVSPGTINLNELYQNLEALKPTSDSEVYKIISKAVREYANPLQTAQGVKLSNLYSLLKKAAPYAQKAKYGMAGATGAGIIWSLRSKIADIFGLD